MKKPTLSGTLAAVCIAAVPAAASAQAAALYGVIDTFVGTIRDKGAETAFVVNSGGMQTSYWGIRGSEDLGGGLKAVYVLESFFRGDIGDQGRSATDAMFARSAFVGLEGAFGRTAFGRNTTPYFVATLSHNPFVDSFTVSPMITHTFRGNVQGDTGMSNSIRFTSPTTGGFQVDALVSAGDELTSDPAAGSGLREKSYGRAFDGAVFYGRGAFSAALAFRSIALGAADNVNDGREQTSWQIGGTYDFKVARLQGQYQHVRNSYDASASDSTLKTWQLGVSVPLGGGSVLASVADTSTDDNSATQPSSRTTWAIGYDYFVSKRTDLYAAYYDDRQKDPAGPEQQVLAFGIRHRF